MESIQVRRFGTVCQSTDTGHFISDNIRLAPGDSKRRGIQYFLSWRDWFYWFLFPGETIQDFQTGEPARSDPLFIQRYYRFLPIVRNGGFYQLCIYALHIDLF